MQRMIGGALFAQVGSKSCTFDGENKEESAHFRQMYEENKLKIIFLRSNNSFLGS